MTWIYLVIAGIFEVAWSIVTIIGMIASFAGLIIATKHLPIGIAYPVWTGIGAVGSVLVGSFLFHDQMNMMTWIFVILLIVSIIGIKITAGH